MQFSTLMECLDMYGFTSYVLSENLICFALEGASVMLESRSGVASRIKRVFPNVIIWHCMNHRLGLAVGDTINEVSGTKHSLISYTVNSRYSKPLSCGHFATKATFY